MRATLAAVCVLLLAAMARAAEPVDYVRDVKPLLEARCNACHGADDQQSGLRLDAAVLARRGGDRGPAIVPGKAGESLLVQVLAGGGDVPRMPFEDDALSKDEIELLTRWVNEGAKAPADEQVAKASNARDDHWSFQPVVRSEPPVVKHLCWVRNPIDAFILAQLESRGLKPSPEADRATLIRRLSLDLRGLPPTLAEIDAFLADERPDAYEQLVDALLRSPQFGERWARHWLDVARYADSNGYTIDGPRNIWKYRDWVIDAVSRDMPINQFVVEQMAGDMLPGATQAQIVATGFHRNTLINQEGGTDQEQFRVEAVVDRVNTTGAAFLGLTLGCARCHEHKYDPVSQRDFYRLFAFLNNADEPNMPVPSAEQARRQSELQTALSAARKQLSAFDAKADQRRAAWEKRLAGLPLKVEWSVLDAQDFESAGGATLTELDDRSLLAGGKIPASDTYTVTLPLPLQGITAVRIEALTHESLPKGGPGLAGNGNFVLTDFKVGRRTLGEPDTVHPVKIVKATAEHSQQRFPVADALDDDPEKSGWAINVASGSLNVDRAAVFIFDKPLAPEDTRLTLTLRHAHPNRYNIGRLRISATSAPAEVLALPADIREALAVLPENRTAEQQQALTVELRRQEPERAPLQEAVNKFTKQLADYKKSIPTTMVMRERSAPRVTHIHIRGDFLRHGARVQPGVPAALPPLPEGIEQPNRLDFARWLVDPANPLTPRVTMNRVWQRLFGQGMVTTENDFGTQGALPTHPQTARLAGQRTGPPRLEPQRDAAAAGQLGNLSAKFACFAGATCRRPLQQVAGPPIAVAAGGRNDSRRGAGRIRAAVGQDRRTGRVPAAAEGHLSVHAEPEELEARYRRGSLPPGHVHVLLAIQPRPVPDDVRRPQRQRDLHAAGAFEHAAAGAHDGQRRGLFRDRAAVGRPRAARVAFAGNQRTAAARVSVVPVARAERLGTRAADGVPRGATGAFQRGTGTSQTSGSAEDAGADGSRRRSRMDQRGSGAIEPGRDDNPRVRFRLVTTS